MKNNEIIVLEPLNGNQPTHLNKTQEFLKPYAPQLIIFWWIVFWTVVTVLLWKLFKTWKEENLKK